MNKLPENIKKFMPSLQQKTVRRSEEFVEIIERLEKELEEIPEDCHDKTVYAHFFYGTCDWFVLSWDRENELVFCYTVLNGDVEMSELGDVYLPELTGSPFVELDFHWEKTSLEEAKYNRYPEYFPKP